MQEWRLSRKAQGNHREATSQTRADAEGSPKEEFSTRYRWHAVWVSQAAMMGLLESRDPIAVCGSGWISTETKGQVVD